MKIANILRETANEAMYTVYKAYGKNDPQVYYGYATGTEDDIARTFGAGVNRTDPDRAEKRLVAINGGDPAEIKFEIMDVFADELDAWVTRNDLRAQDSLSITGPTMFPPEVFNRAKKERPNAVAGWKTARDMNSAATAREAAALGKWDQATIKGLTAKYPRAEVVKDFDGLSPAAFGAKYGI